MADVCDKCDMPAIETERGWEHAEIADAVACAIFNGNVLIIDDDVAVRDE